MYSRKGDRVTLEMPVGDYQNLLYLIGYAAGSAKRERDEDIYWAALALANRLNEGNPEYIAYRIPEKAKP